jgi:hypothetical protein
MGLEVKLKIIENGRAEFVGIHFPVVNGCLSSKEKWMPDVKRTLAKLGVCTTSARGERGVAEAVGSRYLALADVTAGRCTPLAKSFLSLAKDWLPQHAQVNADYSLGTILGVEVGEKVDLDSFRERVERKIEVTDLYDEISYVELSLEKKRGSITKEEYCNWNEFSSTVTRDTTGDSYFQVMPAALRG